MGKILHFEDLEVWQMARGLCKEIYRISNRPPFKSDFKLKAQILGSSGSVMDNIAEGFERNGNKEFIQFLSIAKGSAGETRSQMYRVLDQEYISKVEFDTIYGNLMLLSAKLGSFMGYLKNSEIRGSKYNLKPKP